MQTIRRELNDNFIKWEPVESGTSWFTPCAPLNWYYEVSSVSEVQESDKAELDDSSGRGCEDVGDSEDVKALEELAKLTPPNTELRALASKKRPPVEWMDKDEERPF
jgi:hypothetical protein